MANLSDSFTKVRYSTHFINCGCSACDKTESTSNETTNSTVDYKKLIWDYQGLARNIGDSETVDYNIYYGPFEYTETYNHRDHELHVYRHTEEQADLIRSSFSNLDKIIDIDFNDASGEDQPGDIRIYRAYFNSNWGDRFTEGSKGGGTMYGQNAGIDLEWRDDYDDDSFHKYEKSTIVHEIGHALGLQHPDGSGSNPDWNRYDSIMSYNHPSNRPTNIEFTTNDIAALIEIWGVENDNGRGFQGTDSDNYLKGTKGKDVIAGFAGDDELRGSQGGDTIFGYSGKDLIHGGNGRDHLWGGTGADDVYGGFGHNTFGSEKDGAVDWLYFKSDQFAYNWLYDSSGMNPDGQKVDIFEGLDNFDVLVVEGVETFELSFAEVNDFASPTGTFSGIGIYANGYLEGLYIGTDLTTNDLSSMTRGGVEV